MFEKITFEKNLGIDSSEKKWRGLKIMTVSFLLAIGGAILTFVGLGKVGYWIVVVGVFGGLIGMAMHINAMFSQFSKSGRR